MEMKGHTKRLLTEQRTQVKRKCNGKEKLRLKMRIGPNKCRYQASRWKAKEKTTRETYEGRGNLSSLNNMLAKRSRLQKKICRKTGDTRNLKRGYGLRQGTELWKSRALPLCNQQTRYQLKEEEQKQMIKRQG